MTHQHHTLRPAMTAIAAVIALTATPSLAQSVADTPPIVDTTPAPSVPDPLAAEPTVTTSPEPVASETTTVAPAATARSTTRAARPVARTTTRTTATRSTSAARSGAAAPIAATPSVEAPVATLPIASEAAVAPVAPMVEPAPDAAPATDGIVEALPIAGAAGLGLLALLGGGMVMRRRRRREEDALAQAKRDQIDAAAEPMIDPGPAPTFVRTPQADPVPVAATVVAASELPAGFDVSRFGSHVQAAYRGPTDDNPSVSLKRRLTVGHFLDQEEAEAAPAAQEPSPGKTAAKPAWAARPDGEFMLRRDDKQPSLRPTFRK